MKKKFKGFTLIELIVVMAIFGIIMFAAMQLMIPVSNQFRNTAEYESARASIDNIRRYIDGSLRYADRMVIYSGEDFMASDGSIDQNIIEEKVALFASRFSTDGINDSNSNPYNVDICVMVVNNTSNGTPNVVGTDGSTLIDIYGNVATSGTESIMNGGIISKYVYSPSSSWINALDYNGSTYSLKNSGLSSTYEEYAVNKGLYEDYGFNIYIGNYEYVTDATNDNLILTKMDYGDVSPNGLSFTIDVFKKYNNGNYKTLKQSTALSFALSNTLDSNGSTLDDNITVLKYKTDASGTVLPLTAVDIGKNDSNPAALGDNYDNSDYGDSGTIEELYKLKNIGSRFTNIKSSTSQINDNFFIIYTIPKRASEITN